MKRSGRWSSSAFARSLETSVASSSRDFPSSDSISSGSPSTRRKISSSSPIGSWAHVTPGSLELQQRGTAGTLRRGHQAAAQDRIVSQARHGTLSQGTADEARVPRRLRGTLPSRPGSSQAVRSIRIPFADGGRIYEGRRQRAWPSAAKISLPPPFVGGLFSERPRTVRSPLACCHGPGVLQAARTPRSFGRLRVRRSLPSRSWNSMLPSSKHQTALRPSA